MVDHHEILLMDEIFMLHLSGIVSIYYNDVDRKLSHRSGTLAWGYTYKSRGLICSRFVGGCHLYCVKRQALYSVANTAFAVTTRQSCNCKSLFDCKRRLSGYYYAVMQP